MPHIAETNSENYKNYLVKSLKSISKTRKVEFISGNQIARLQCPNPGHKGGQEAHPSFTINLVKRGTFWAGSGKCHSCGLYLSKWSKILDAVKRPDLIQHESLIEYDEDITVGDQEKLTQSLLGSEESSFKFTRESIPWPRHQIWRGISGDLVDKVGGQLYFDNDQETQMLYLPCYVNGSEVGGVRANLEKRGKLNYFNTPGSWTKNLGLYPYDYIVTMLEETGIRTLTLTEGVRDPLNSIQHGIPALAILGVENWSEVKAELILALPIDRIVLAFDPDEAGNKATRKVYKTLKDEIPVRRFDFSKYGEDENGNFFDPGAMTASIAKRLKKLALGVW